MRHLTIFHLFMLRLRDGLIVELIAEITTKRGKKKGYRRSVAAAGL